MKSKFEVECIIQEIKKQFDTYLVEIVMEDNRDLIFHITEKDE